jgi:hypothetical protein
MLLGGGPVGDPQDDAFCCTRLDLTDLKRSVDRRLSRGDHLRCGGAVSDIAD